MSTWIADREFTHVTSSVARLSQQGRIGLFKAVALDFKSGPFEGTKKNGPRAESVGIIVVKGSLVSLVKLDFNEGDILFLIAAISWAVYSVILKSKVFADIDTMPLFALIATFGAVILSPIALWEIAIGQDLPSTSRQWSIIAGITLFAGLIAYSTFQFGVRIVGPSIAGIFMYLMPLYGIYFAWLFLGEQIQSYHVVGISAVLVGVVLATFPANMVRKQSLQ